MAYTRAGRRLAEESQLLSEERWIIEAIKKIRTQRNCLQIERLQLESMLATQKLSPSTMDPTLDTKKIVEQNLNENIQNPTTLLQNMQSLMDMTSNNLPDRGADDLCNIETLDLGVTNPTRRIGFSNVMFAEDNDEEEDDEEPEEVDIDMNMFMNSSVM